MRSLKQAGYVSGAVVFALGLWSLKTTNLFSSTKNTQALIQGLPNKKEPVMVASDRSTASIPVADAVAPSSATPAINLVTDTAVLEKKSILSSEQAESIHQYQVIKTKVFLSEQEKFLKKKLMMDESLIKVLTALLLQSNAVPMGSEEYEQRNLALDLLIEASVAANSPAANAALMQIVQDKQIENEKLPAADRQAMAEMKADLLYTWTAKAPAQSEKIAGVIPGPVTAKIWTNAQAAQEQNRIESASVK